MDKNVNEKKKIELFYASTTWTRRLELNAAIWILCKFIHDDTALLIPNSIHGKFRCFHQDFGTGNRLQKLSCFLPLTTPRLFLIVFGRPPNVVITALTRDFNGIWLRDGCGKEDLY